MAAVHRLRSKIVIHDQVYCIASTPPAHSNSGDAIVPERIAPPDPGADPGARRRQTVARADRSLQTDRSKQIAPNRSPQTDRPKQIAPNGSPQTDRPKHSRTTAPLCLPYRPRHAAAQASSGLPKATSSCRATARAGLQGFRCAPGTSDWASSVLQSASSNSARRTR